MVFTCGKLNLYVAFFQVKTTMVFNHQWICKQWKCWDDVYGALMFFSKISSGRTIFLKGWLCIWMPVFQVIWSSAFIYRLTRWEALYKGKFGYEYRYDSAGGTRCFTNSKLSLFSTYLTSSILLPIQIFLLFKCSLFFQITVSFIFHSPVTSWKVVLQHSFLENKSTLLKYPFSCMTVFHIIKANSG